MQLPLKSDFRLEGTTRALFQGFPMHLQHLPIPTGVREPFLRTGQDPHFFFFQIPDFCHTAENLPQDPEQVFFFFFLHLDVYRPNNFEEKNEVTYGNGQVV